MAFKIDIGDKVIVSAGTETFEVVYANNSTSITFPTGATDGSTSTLTTKFFMGETEVTYALWKTVYDWATDISRTNRYYFANQGREGNDGVTGAAATNQEPVTNISWRDAIVWCNALTEYYNTSNGTSITCAYTYTGAIIRDSRDANATACDGAVVNASSKGFRLPTKMEWEYAARYRTDSTNTVPGYSNPYFTKGNSASGATKAYDDPNTDNTTYAVVGVLSTAIVMSKGIFSANSLGLYDMSGNIWEWCYDLNITDREARGGNYNGDTYTLQVGRSGSWTSSFRNYAIGFRFARTQ